MKTGNQKTGSGNGNGVEYDGMWARGVGSLNKNVPHCNSLFLHTNDSSMQLEPVARLN